MEKAAMRVLTTRLPVPLAEKVDEISQRLERSKGWILQQALMDWIHREEERTRLTLEGLGDALHLHPIQQAFVSSQAAQCGYCLNGMIIATKALLDRSAHPSDAEIKGALKYHLCRCGTHMEILDAVRRARDAIALSQRSP